MKEVLFNFGGADYKVRQPTPEENKQALYVRTRTFTEALTNGAILQDTVPNILKEKGLWDDNKQNEIETIAREIRDNEVKLHKGGMKLSDARNLALHIKKLRDKYADLFTVFTKFNSNYTAEGIANNAQFDYLLSVCLVYLDNRPVYSSLADYQNRSDEDLAVFAAGKLANLLYKLDEDFMGSLPENKFLRDWKFVDDKGRLINQDGHLITEDGKLINENGELVDANGNRVDIDGNSLDKDGNLLIESQPFLDDDGNPIVIADSDKDSAKTKKKVVQT